MMRRARCMRCKSLFIAAGEVSRCPGCGRRGRLEDLDFLNGGPTAQQVLIAVVAQSTGPQQSASRTAGALLLTSGILAGLVAMWTLVILIHALEFGEGVWMITIPTVAFCAAAACNVRAGAATIAGRTSILGRIGTALIFLGPFAFLRFGILGYIMSFTIGTFFIAPLAGILGIVGLVLARVSPPATSNASVAPLVTLDASAPSLLEADR